MHFKKAEFECEACVSHAAAVCEHTDDADAMPEELVRLVNELPFVSLPWWSLSSQLESVSLPAS